MTRTEWAALVAAADIVAEPVRLERRGTWWTWNVTVNGVPANDYLDHANLSTKRAATAAVPDVIAEVRESLADPWNFWNETDGMAASSDPVVVSLLTKS